MAPALDFDNWLFTNTKKISQANIPVEIVTGGSDTEELLEKNASFFAANIPNSTLTILPEQITHWPFLNESTPKVKKLFPLLP